MKKKLVNIDYLSNLARIELTDEEKETIAPQLESILQNVGKLALVDTSMVDMTTEVGQQAWRKDEICISTNAEHEACMNAFPDKLGTALRVPAIFEDESEIL